MSTWWDRITIAFITFLFLLALLAVVFVGFFLAEFPEVVHSPMRNTWWVRLMHAGFALHIPNGD